jgi:hypothetical protein
MKKTFWMFSILLMIITITSSVGGSIRYRENFLEEVFDVTDIDSYQYDNNLLDTFRKPKKNIVIEEESIIQEESIQPKQMRTKPTTIRNNIKPTVVPSRNVYDTIEGYTGDSYASI